MLCCQNWLRLLNILWITFEGLGTISKILWRKFTLCLILSSLNHWLPRRHTLGLFLTKFLLIWSWEISNNWWSKSLIIISIRNDYCISALSLFMCCNTEAMLPRVLARPINFGYHYHYLFCFSKFMWMISHCLLWPLTADVT